MHITPDKRIAQYLERTTLSSLASLPRPKRARHLANALHANQTRKVSGLPYAVHLAAVAETVRRHGGDQDQCDAAWLHDAVEDQGGSGLLDDIASACGKRVASLVMWCTAMSAPGTSWHDRKAMQVIQLRQAPADVLLIKAADQWHNVTSLLDDYQFLGDQVWRFLDRSSQDFAWYFRESTAVFRGLVPGALVNALDQMIARLEALPQA